MSSPGSASAPRSETRTGVAAADVATVEALFNAETPPPTSVVSTPDGSGTFTVVATWANG